MPKVEAQGIKLDAIIDIQVSGGFYSRLHQLLQSMAMTVSTEEFQKMLQRITDGKTTTAIEYHIETLIVLIHEVEEKAKIQGKVTTEVVEVEE